MLKQWLLSLLAVIALPAAAWAETPGKDGSVTVSAANTVVNQYAAISGSVGAGGGSVTAVNLAAAMPGLAPGDLIMLYQAQGATIDSSDTTSYGAVTAYNNAGRYEFQTVGSVSGNTITFATYASMCSGARYGYAGASGAQIVRVPQYRALTVNAGASIAGAAWSGTTGGVVAVTVSGTLTLTGSVNATGIGFRGGALDNLAFNPGGTGYASTDAATGAEKGEGIAGYQATLPGGAYYGRGAPANGGGGGNAHNAGGGGGANGNNGNTWAGQGRPDLSGTNWSAAWNLDGTVTSTTNNSGGGRGGYTYAQNDQNAITVAPGNATWGGDTRRQVGGLGGRPLAYDRTGRAFFGGGGGAGDANNTSGGAGGRGGGFVFIKAASASGSGSVLASGSVGNSTVGGNNDAPGGGGGGGTIVAQIATGGSFTMTADGGAGGSQLTITLESEGPGGGGGGGVVAASGGALATNARGGVNGTTASTALTEFIPNGATQGATGQATATAPSNAETPICYAPPPTVLKTGSTYSTTGINRFNVPQADVIYTITFTNPGTALDGGTVVLTDTLPAELDFYNGDIDDAGPLTGPFEFVDGSTASGVTCCTGAQIAYSAQNTGTDFSYVPAAGYDPAVRRVRLTPGGAMNPGSFTASSFLVRLRARIK